LAVAGEGLSLCLWRGRFLLDLLRREVPATSLVVAVDPGKAFNRVRLTTGEQGLIGEPVTLPVLREGVDELERLIVTSGGVGRPVIGLEATGALHRAWASEIERRWPGSLRLFAPSETTAARGQLGSRRFKTDDRAAVPRADRADGSVRAHRARAGPLRAGHDLRRQGMNRAAKLDGKRRNTVGSLSPSCSGGSPRARRRSIARCSAGPIVSGVARRRSSRAARSPSQALRTSSEARRVRRRRVLC
jgi:hypothetical protein